MLHRNEFRCRCRARQSRYCKLACVSQLIVRRTRIGGDVSGEKPAWQSIKEATRDGACDCRAKYNGLFLTIFHAGNRALEPVDRHGMVGRAIIPTGDELTGGPSRPAACRATTASSYLCAAGFAAARRGGCTGIRRPRVSAQRFFGGRVDSRNSSVCSTWTMRPAPGARMRSKSSSVARRPISEVGWRTVVRAG